MSQQFKWLDSPWINRVLFAALIWFIKDGYQTLRGDIAVLQVEATNIKGDVQTLRREVELIENFNIQPK